MVSETIPPRQSRSARNCQKIGDSTHAPENKTFPQIRIILRLDKALDGVLKFRPEEIRGEFSGKKAA